ncbi:MAG: hypothetical protein LBI48_09730 [Burkholderiaceae bacterium]|nr:hypothetical protein [Burkholderiaceae bacterium]
MHAWSARHGRIGFRMKLFRDQRAYLYAVAPTLSASHWLRQHVPDAAVHGAAKAIKTIAAVKKFLIFKTSAQSGLSIPNCGDPCLERMAIAMAIAKMAKNIRNCITLRSKQ